MLRALAMFLLLFTVLASVVHTDGLVNLFGLGALALLATDLFVTRFGKHSTVSKTRRVSLL